MDRSSTEPKIRKRWKTRKKPKLRIARKKSGNYNRKIWRPCTQNFTEMRKSKNRKRVMFQKIPQNVMKLKSSGKIWKTRLKSGFKDRRENKLMI